ncbi:msf superfamily transporter [Ophiostoma piceae UAMH 11346]|uniref:Msf superfamily transporter n=1 Tax=Ophiostoma piceae (strain UAMH 11346) TaxID=1262450 RepID=S3C6G2_OPHP1|nr:msf superfamily transporter [Ophiostoma piceae UAMH 11346]
MPSSSTAPTGDGAAPRQLPGDAEDPFTIHSDDSDDGGGDEDIDDIKGLVESERQGLVPQPSLHKTDNEPQVVQEEYVDAHHDDSEPPLTVRQAVKTYRKAIFWCLVTSACVIMEGYDMILIGNFFAYPTFAKKYGQFVDSHGQHQLSPAWQAILSNSSPVGCFIGTWLNGLLVPRHGQKRVLLGALASLTATIFLTFFAPNIVVLAVGEFLCGLPWGVFASSAPAYASELLPTALRVYLTSWTNMCFIVGQLIAAGVLAGLVHREDDWAFRIPFALQWVWPVLIFPALWFAPESPWHLVRTGRTSDARASLRRLQTGGSVDSTLRMIVRTNEQEMRSAGTAVATRYWDCFRGIERRRTEIACVAFAAQVLSGSPFAYNSTYFYQQIGLATQATYLLNTGGTVLSLAGTVVNWLFLMPRYGRRPIFLCGLCVMCTLLMSVGILSLVSQSAAVSIIQAALTIAWTFVFQLSVGQLGWALPAEVGSTRLRQKTVCLARNAYYAASITSNIVEAQLLNPSALDWKGGVGFFWGTSCLLVLVWGFFRLPETKDRSFEELDWLFTKHVPSRKFSTTRVPRNNKGVDFDGLSLQNESAYHRIEDTEMERLVASH